MSWEGWTRQARPVGQEGLRNDSNGVDTVDKMLKEDFLLAMYVVDGYVAL